MGKRNSNFVSNKNAIIASRVDRTNKLRTETQRRDNGSVEMAISTDKVNNSTNLFIDIGEDTVRLDGHEARSLYRLLRKHYGYTGKSRSF